MKPAPQIAGERLATTRWHHGAGEWKAPSAISNPPRFRGKPTYRQHRPMVERSIAWLVRGTNRRLRYRGTERNRLWLGHRVAAINLQRLINLGLTHSAQGWAIA